MRKIAIKHLLKKCQNCGVAFINPRNYFFCSRKCSNISKIGKRRPQGVQASINAASRFRKEALKKKGKTYEELYGERAAEERNKRKNQPKVKRKINLLWWNRGRKPEYRNLHGGKEYAQWRKSVYERDNYTCQTCGERGGNLQAHHLKSWSRYPDKRYDLKNGVTLDKECHRKWNKVQRMVESLIFSN